MVKLTPQKQKKIKHMTDPIQSQEGIMLRLLGFPRATPESGPGGCSHSPESIVVVQSGGAGGPCTAGRWAPGGCVAAGLDALPAVHVCLPASFV